jgi:methionyl-tRNA formyltransferase
MLKKEDGLIHWEEAAVIIDRKVRGFFPWPGAYTSFQGKRIKLLHVAIEEETAKNQGALPGTVLELDHEQGPLIATGHDSIRIIRIQPQNKKPMSCSDFCRGYRLTVGDTLGK